MSGFLEALARMPNVTAACRLVGVTRNMAYRTARSDAAFREAWREAIEVGVDVLEGIAHRRATTGEPRVETRRRVKRAVNDMGELVVVEEEIVTTEITYVSDSLLITLLKAYRPRRFREHAGPHLAPGDDLDQAQAVAPEDDGINRVPTRERMLALAKLALELEPDAVDAKQLSAP
jgi:hypothetical protein